MKLVYILNARMPTERAHGLQTMRMCEALLESGVDVTLLLPRRWQNNRSLREQDVFEFYGLSRPFPIRRVPHLDLLPLEPYIGLGGLRPFIIAANSAFGIIAALSARSMRPDLCFTREWMVAWWLVRLGVPTVYESHVMDGISFSRRAGKALVNASKSPNMLRVVAITEAVKHDLIARGVPEEKTIALPDAVDIRRYAVADPEGPLPWKQYGDPLVVYTGSLYESKGVYALAQAAARLGRVQVVLQGGPPEEYRRLSRFVSERGLDNVVVGEHRPPSEIPALQQAADVLAYTPAGDTPEQSLYTSPIKLYEYMAAGRPIVASDLPSIREVLTHEVTALLVEPGDPEAVASGVRRLLDDPSLGRRLAQNARRKVEGFTWQSRVRKLLEAVNIESASTPEVYA